MDFVNENIPPGSKIIVWKNNMLAKAYARETYEISAHSVVPEEEYESFDYAIVPIRQMEEQTTFAKYPVVFSVEIDNASLVVVLKLSNDAE